MISDPFQIAVNDRYDFEAGPEEAKNLDAVPDGHGKFHILHNGRSYHAQLLEVDYARRRYSIRLNGSKYTLKIADHYERLMQQLGLNTAGTHKINAVKAPMPGLVLQVLVEPGQSVQKGEPLVILEAMKMENVIKSAGEGQVKIIKVVKGAAVEKGQLLLEME